MTWGLAALVEAHDEKEVASAVAAGAQIIGGNNRNLRDFSVNLDNAARLRDRVPGGCCMWPKAGYTARRTWRRCGPWGPMGSSSGRPLCGPRTRALC